MSTPSAEKLRQFFARGSRGLKEFLDTIVVPASPRPVRFSACAEPWQVEKLLPKIPAIEYLAGRGYEYTGPLRFMDILARGHNKSSEEAWLACYLVAFSERVIDGRVLAADRDQGRLVVRAAETLLRLNPWIPARVQKDAIIGPSGSVEVLPFDASSSMGLRCNFYIADEIVHWKRQQEWTALVTGLRKVTPTVFCVLSNAGLLGSWQHEAFEEAKVDPEWAVFHREGQLAGWLSAEGIARDRKMIPPSEAKRLYDNVWIDPSEEHDYLRRSEVESCAALGSSLIYRLRRQAGVTNYVAGIDYGPRRDRTAMCVLHQREDRVVVVDRLDVWQGTPDEPVAVSRVEEWVKDVRAAFNPAVFVLDPYQMEGTIQWMKKQGMPVEAWSPRAGAGNFLLAQTLRALVAEGRLTWYPGAGDLSATDKRTGREYTDTLAEELVGLRVRRMPYGYRFDHDNQRHDDRATAITMAAVRSLDLPAHVRAEVPAGPIRRGSPAAPRPEDE